MHLRPTTHSDQHNLLLKLEAAGHVVFYIAPEFHHFAELNSFYMSRTVVTHSAAFSPQAIGSLDDKEHYVVFERGTTFGHLCSTQPVRVVKTDLHDGLYSALAGRSLEARNLGEFGLREICRQMMEVLTDSDERLKVQYQSIDVNGLRKIVESRSIVESVGFMSRAYFDSELIILK